MRRAPPTVEHAALCQAPVAQVPARYLASIPRFGTLRETGVMTIPLTAAQTTEKSLALEVLPANRIEALRQLKSNDS